MTDRPIIFSAPMIRALLAGTKTQTRRLFRPPLPFAPEDDISVEVATGSIAPRQQPGDRLWVREAWAHYQTINHVRRTDGGAFDEVSDGLAGYRADGHDTIEDFRQHVRLMSGCDLEHVVINGDRWRSPIHMPRWASRITLHVEDVRVQRLEDISEEDARAEGPGFIGKLSGEVCDSAAAHRLGGPRWRNARDWYADLWDSLHGADAWQRNPWIVALTFRVIHANIDAPEAS